MEVNQVMCYSEVGANELGYGSLFGDGSGEKKLWDWTKLAEGKNLKRIKIKKNSDLWPALKKLFGGRE